MVDNIIADSNKIICRVTVFSKHKIKGIYRYKDEFQIFPYISDEIPESEFQDVYPVTLEFKRNPLINDIAKLGQSIWAKEDRILTLLNTFTNNYFYKNAAPELQLGYLLSELKTGNPKLGWFINEFQLLLKNREMFFENFFTRINEPIEVKEHTTYFLDSSDFFFESNNELILPQSIDKMFEAYFNLDDRAKDFVDTATDYVTNSIQLIKRQKTLSLISSFTAIETMVNLEHLNTKINHCSECKQPIYSITKKFVAFLLKYVDGGDENEKEYKRIYKKRSEIIHSGTRLKTENYFAVINDDEEQEERNFRATILQLSRLAINNWLLAQN